VIWVSAILTSSVKVGQTFVSHLFYSSNVTVFRTKLEHGHSLCALNLDFGMWFSNNNKQS